LLIAISFCASAKDGVRLSCIEMPGGYIEMELNADSSSVTLTPIPNTDYQFFKWVDDPSQPQQRTVSLAAFTSSAAPDTMLRAAFIHIPSTIFPEGTVSVAINNPTIPSYTLTLTESDPIITPFSCWNNAIQTNPMVYNETMGCVIPRFQGRCAQTWSCPGGKVIYSVGDEYYHLAAQANENYEFMGWIDGNTDNPRLIRVSDISRAVEKTYHAVFVHQPSVHLRGGDVQVTVTNQIQPTFLLEAIPTSAISEFSRWNNNKLTNPLQYVEADGHIYPRFNGVVIDTVHGVGGYITFAIVGKTCVMEAIANKDYQFQQWTDENRSNPRTINLAAGNAIRDMQQYAVFVHQPSVHYNRDSVRVIVNDKTVPSFYLSIAMACGSNTFSCWNTGVTNSTIPYEESDGQVTPRFVKMIPEEEEGIGGHIEFEETECGYLLSAVPDSGFTFSYWEDYSTDSIREVPLYEEYYTATFRDSKYPYKVGNNYYETPADAVSAAASSGNELEILMDVNNSMNIVGSVTINGNAHQIGDLTVDYGGILSLSSVLHVRDLYINATTGASGQMQNFSDLKYDNLYLNYQLEPNRSAAYSTKWYAFSVPFEVDVVSGISRLSGGTKPVINQDYFIYEYDGNLRASTKENGWVKMYDGKLHPGLFYMMRIQGSENHWLFTKDYNASVGGSSRVQLYQFMSNYQNRGWNAVGNSLITYADAYVPSIDYVQVFNNTVDEGKYEVRHINSLSFVVASPFFVQVQNDSQMTLSEATHSDLHAPTRFTSQEEKVFYEVQLSNATQSDRLYITAHPSASTNYEIGKDVVKLFSGNTQTYLWTNAYGYKLCAQDAVLSENSTEFDLTLCASASGEYTLSASGTTQYPLYLMYQGQQIWTLSESDYSLDLTQGNNTGYSLRIGSKQEIGTGVDQTNTPIQITKMIYQGLLYIYREGHLYNAQGELVQ